MARAFAPYAAVLRSRLRSQVSYRASFATDLVSSLLTGLTELAEVWILFTAASVLGGLDLAGGLLLFGLSSFSFSIADLVVGHIERVPRYVLSGQLDVFYLRPQPILAQLITSDISLKRLVRTAVGVVSLTLGLLWSSVHWTPARVAMLALSLALGWVVFSASFVVAASIAFFVLDSDEIANAVTYGGSYAARQPASVFPIPLRAVFAFVVPVAFVGYLPTLVLLGLGGPALLPAGLAWALPLVAALFWGVALVCWRAGMRHYQSGGG